jgi:hypothetical protein
MPYGSLVNVTNDSHEMNLEEEKVMKVDIENPELQHLPVVPPKVKRKHAKAVNEIQLDTPINPSTTTELHSDGKKATGKKRKVESIADSSAVKKSKKIKTLE